MNHISMYPSAPAWNFHLTHLVESGLAPVAQDVADDLRALFKVLARPIAMQLDVDLDVCFASTELSPLQ